MRLLATILCICTFFSVQTASAQLGSTLNEQESIALSNEFPRPGETFTASLNVFNSFWRNASIEWVIDGSRIENVSNRREIELEAGTAGKNVRIQAILTQANGATLTLTKDITPVYLDIVIEPQTHVPVFYKGMPLPSIGSIVNATALIDTGRLRNDDLVYTWRVNQTVLEQGPIRTRNTVSFEMPRGNRATLYLTVNEPSGTLVAQRAIYIPSVYPELHFYEESSLYGPSITAVDKTILMVGNSLTLLAEPYNLDVRVFNNPDVHEWKLGSNTLSNQDSNPYQVTLQRNSSGGVSNVQFQVRSLEQILQGASGATNISY